MSFDLKNIQNENINFKKVIPIAISFVFIIIASLIFVYYYFSFEKKNIMNEHYLKAPSKIRELFNNIEDEKLRQLDIKNSMNKIIKKYAK